MVPQRFATAEPEPEARRWEPAEKQEHREELQTLSD